MKNNSETRPTLHQTETVCQDSSCTVTHITGRSGDMCKRSYPVFPGITLVYNDVRMQEVEETESDSDSIYEINHCSKGRIESSAGAQFFYLTPGDLSIHRKKERGKISYFPTSHYQGISVLIDTNCAPKCFSCLLNDVNVHPQMLMEKFCKDGEMFIARSNEHLEHVFSELYHIPEEVRKGYLKIKVLEIFLFLSCMPETEEEERKSYTASQVTLAKQVCKFLTAHIADRITIDDLSKVFHVSPTQLKNCFKGVFGISVYSYIRTQKMQRAAEMLLSTDKTVLEIANLHSYDNASKFAKAFSDVMHMTPTEYRRLHAVRNP